MIISFLFSSLIPLILMKYRCPRADVMNHIMHNIYLVSLSIVTIMIIAIIVSYYYSKKTIFALNTTKHFLGAVANGDLTTEIDPYVLQRHDEIGDMGRFAVMMKESLSDLVGKDPLTGLHNRQFHHEIGRAHV